MWEEPANIKTRSYERVSGVGMVWKGGEPTKSRNTPPWACFCFSSGGEPADNKNASTWTCFCCLYEGKGKGASENQKHAHKGMFLVFELRKACEHQKRVCIDAFLVSTRGERLGWVLLDRRELERCGRLLKTENTPRWACFLLCS